MTVSEQLEQMRESRRGLYDERVLLLAVLASVWPSHLTPRVRRRSEWQLCIHSPAGNLSWAVHKGELDAFRHVKRDSEPHWDGSDDNTRKDRLKALARKSA